MAALQQSAWAHLHFRGSPAAFIFELFAALGMLPVDRSPVSKTHAQASAEARKEISLLPALSAANFICRVSTRIGYFRPARGARDGKDASNGAFEPKRASDLS